MADCMRSAAITVSDQSDTPAGPTAAPRRQGAVEGGAGLLSRGNLSACAAPVRDPRDRQSSAEQRQADDGHQHRRTGVTRELSDVGHQILRKEAA